MGVRFFVVVVSTCGLCGGRGVMPAGIADHVQCICMECKATGQIREEVPLEQALTAMGLASCLKDGGAQCSDS